MKRAIILFGITLCLAAAACTREKEPDTTGSQTDGNSFAKTEEIVSGDSGDSTRFIFRKTWWGMTLKEVVASEGIRPRMLDDNIMIYATVWKNRPAEITYYFDRGLLGMAEYSISEPGMRIQDYLDLYNGLRLQMIDRYGKPALDDYSRSGFSKVAIGNSHVFKQSPTLWNRLSNWELPEIETEILLYLGYSTAQDDSTKSCDVQFKSNKFSLEKFTGDSR